MRGPTTAVLLVCATACGPTIESEVPGSQPAPRRSSARPVCPGKPLFASDHVYCVVAEPRSFAGAAAACRASGMELATIRSSEQNEALRAVMTRASVTGGHTSVWIGLSDVEKEGEWRWTSGTPLRSPSWAAREPNDAGGNEDCGQVYVESNAWNDFPCAAELPYVCERAKAASGPFGCRGTPVSVRGAEYCVYAEARSWADASASCAAEGSALAEFETVEERVEFGKRVTPDPLPRSVWIGATDAGNEGRFEWLDGTPVGFFAFGSGEPNNAGGAENCVEWLGPDGKWNDLPCEMGRAALCEVRGRR